MNDAELDKLLKAARPPERSAGHWASLAKKITARLHWQERAEDVAPSRRFRFPLWGLGLATACIAGVLVVQHWQKPGQRETSATDPFADAEKCYREIREMFPNQLRSIVLSDDGSRIELADAATQSDAQPILLKICGPKSCESVITFSGQRIRVGGEECDVLADGAGGVIVTGEKSVWTSDEPARQLSQYRIQAKQMKPS